MIPRIDYFPECLPSLKEKKEDDKAKEMYSALWKSLADMPVVLGSCCKVYFPSEDQTIVLKKFKKGMFCGFEPTIKRSKILRAILAEQQAERIIVPSLKYAEHNLKWTVEERLSVNVNFYHQMAIYCQYANLFHQAIKEMTVLFSKGHFEGLALPRYPYEKIKRKYFWSANFECYVCYNKMPLFLRKEKGEQIGCIGLISPKDWNNKTYLNAKNACYLLTRLFPLHISLILDQAKALNWSLNEVEIEEIKDAAAQGKKYLEEGYFVHANFLKEKKVSLFFQEFFTLKKKDKKCIHKQLKKIFSDFKKGQLQQKYCWIPMVEILGGSTEKLSFVLIKKTLKLFTESVVLTINSQLQKKNEEKFVNADFITTRSCELHLEELLQNFQNILKKDENIFFISKERMEDVHRMLEKSKTLVFINKKSLLKTIAEHPPYQEFSEVLFYETMQRIAKKKIICDFRWSEVGKFGWIRY